MARPSLVTRIKRWLAGRPRLLAGGFATATFLVVSLATAQEHPLAPNVVMQPAPAPAPTAVDTEPSAHPITESEESGESESEEEAEPHGAGDEHAGKPHAKHDHSIGMPERFNLGDLERYKKDKDEVAAGKREAATTPYIYVLINALVLFAIYYYAGKKPIGDGLKARRDTVAKELDEAAKIKAEAKAKLEEYTERLEKLDQELDRMKAELVLAGEKDRDRIVKEAEEKAERMRKDAQFLLDQELKQLRIDLLKYTVDAAAGAAEKVLSTTLTAQDRDRLADEYLAQLGQLPAANALGTTAPTKGSAS